MDFEFDEQQEAIADAVERLLADRAGPERAAELDAAGEVDTVLERALAEAGFLGIALEPETGFLEAALVVERVAQAGGVISVGAQALVAPALLGRIAMGPVALAAAGEAVPIRFAAHALVLIKQATRPHAGAWAHVEALATSAERKAMTTASAVV